MYIKTDSRRITEVTHDVLENVVSHIGELL